MPNSSQMVVTRFGRDGKPDASFGRDGRAFADFGGLSLTAAAALQPDGRIIVVGCRSTSSTWRRRDSTRTDARRELRVARPRHRRRRLHRGRARGRAPTGRPGRARRVLRCGQPDRAAAGRPAPSGRRRWQRNGAQLPALGGGNGDLHDRAQGEGPAGARPLPGGDAAQPCARVCSRYVRVGGFARSLEAGPHRVPFSGRLRGRGLRQAAHGSCPGRRRGGQRIEQADRDVPRRAMKHESEKRS
jgi:hypothetical protein